MDPRHPRPAAGVEAAARLRDHAHALVRDHAEGRDILDLAAGDGQGAASLAAVARSVVGLVPGAMAAPPAPANLRFLPGAATRLPLPDASIDIAIGVPLPASPATLDPVLAEARRVLRPGGLLLIGVAAEGGDAQAADLAARLGRLFAHARLLGQGSLLGSALAPLGGGLPGGWRVIAPADGPSAPEHLVALASDGALPEMGASLHLAVSGVARAAAPDPAAREAELRALRREAASLMAQLEQLRADPIWRLAEPLRALAERHPGIGRLGRRAARAAWWTVTGQLPRRLRERRAARASRAALLGIDLRAALDLPPPEDAAPDPASIRLPTEPKAPRISVIIPSYGQVDHTLRCLASIAAHPPAAPFEVLVVEDASGDPAVPRLEQVQGLRLVRWPENRGFLRSCNEAAGLARGEMLFFLNNDTRVMPGAIDALAQVLDAHPEAGMAGSRLLYPDGRLQEAGGIIWRDGSGWNYGNGDDPRKPEYAYLREADYISGAAIMLPRARWEEMGGFDEAFLPAYCEDSDLAFRLRAAGHKVLYQPDSVVIHHEGATHGTDTQAGVKAHQVANTRRLFERWRATLERDAFPSGERVMRARDRAARRTVTLVVDHYVPEPDRDAGSRTMLAFMDALLASGRIVKFLPANLARPPGYTEALQRRGIEVPGLPWTARVEAWLALHGAEIDEILLSRPSVAVELLAPLRAHCPAAPVAFYGHDLHFARMALAPAATDSAAGRRAVARMEALERRLWRMSDIVLYPSEEEAERVRALEPQVRARGITAYAFPPAPARAAAPPATGGIVFVGGFRHAPNVDAALWLAREILPAIRRDHREVPLSIMGSHPPPEILALAGPGIAVRGFVPDEELEAAYAQARLAICPLRYGAGVKLKVVEAMARGVPVVTTEVGAQGLPGIDAVCDIAGTTEAIAAAAGRLITDDALWRARADAGAAFVAARFSLEAIRDALDAAFAEARGGR